MKTFETLPQVMRELRGHIGSIQSFYQINKGSTYTEGFKEFKELAQCHWLYDIMETEVWQVLKKLDKLDVFYFKVECQDEAGGGRTVDLSLSDYRGKKLWSRHIDFTTLPTGEETFICGWDGVKMTTCLVQEN